MINFPKITFGIIVLNGEPFVRYNLRSLYPFAKEIIVVEGAAPAAATIATPDGHSTDGTLEALREFKAYEDPNDKLTIVTAEDEGYYDGFWPGEKHEQSQAYAKRATGDYLWQVDIDEFYKPEDMRAILNILIKNPQISAVSFKILTFWGGFDYLTDGWILRRGAGIYYRLFKWGPGYRYVTHRPPTVIDQKGRNLRYQSLLDGRTLVKKGIFLYHYSLLFPKQVREKCAYYSAAEWLKSNQASVWAENNYFKITQPYRVHNLYDHPSWLERYRGTQPPQIAALREDLLNGRLQVEMRQSDDIESLLRSPWYCAGRMNLKLKELIGRSVPLWLHRYERFISDPRKAINDMRDRLVNLLR